MNRGRCTSEQSVAGMNAQPLPLVSILTIFLNEEKFLPQAVESVLSQTYQDWELILVDDGSTDRSSEIAQAYAAAHPQRIRYLEHPGHQNRGMSATRNLGIRAARGQYIAFLDADDAWLIDKLAGQIPILASKPEVGFLCAPARYWYGWTGDPQDIQRDFVQQFVGIPVNTTIRPPILLSLFLRNEWATLCDVIVRREVVEAIGGYEESFGGMFEDQAFHAKLCLSFTAILSSRGGYLYRQHPNSCTSVSHASGTHAVNRLRYLTWLEAYFSKQQVKDRRLRQILRRELWPLRHPVLGSLIYPVKVQLQILLGIILKFARAIIPAQRRERMLSRLRGLQQRPPVGWVRFGNLRQVDPIGPVWPNRRGMPVDRYYIEGFLERNAGDVKGHVLELGDASYTRRFGGERVTHSDVLHAIEGNPAATIVADLTSGDHLPADTFDCIILTQALLLIYDLKAALKTLYRILKPGGVLLATVPGITPIVRDDMEENGQFWSFTSLSIRRLFAEFFPVENLAIEVYGNVLAAIAFLHGMATSELRRSELDYQHPDFELIIAVRAQKPGRQT